MKRIIVVFLIMCILFLTSCANQYQSVITSTNIAINHLEFYQVEEMDKCDSQEMTECPKADKLEEWILFLKSVEGYLSTGEYDTICSLLEDILQDMALEEVDEETMMYIKDIEIIMLL